MLPKAVLFYLGGGGFCNFGMVTLQLEAVQIFFPSLCFRLTMLMESGYACSEGSLQQGPLRLQTAVTRRLLLQNYLLELAKCLEQTHSSWGLGEGGEASCWV